MKHIKTIQIIMKVCSIITKVANILSQVGLWFCIIGLVFVAVTHGLGLMEEAKIASMVGSTRVEFPTIYASLLIGLTSCLGAHLITRKWMTYFKAELEDGTPFVEETGLLLFHVAKYELIIAFVSFILCVVIAAVSEVFGGVFTRYDIKFSLDINTVIFAFFLSLVFRSGAEQIENRE